MGMALPQVVASDRASGAQVIDGSLWFDDSFKTNLGRTPGSVGNRRIFTWSGWTKRSQLGDTQRLMFVGDGSNYFSISFNNDTVQVEEAGGSNAFYVYTDALLRDTGWYHVAVTVDTTQATQTNRVKVYVNGVDQALTAGNNWPPLNAELQINNTVDHRIGRNDADCFNGLLTNTYLIDGQALGPENFGFTDPLTNTWRPKKFSGDFNVPGGAGGTLANYNSNTTLPTYSDQGGGSFGGGANSIANAFDGSASTYCNMTYLNGQWSRLTFENPITNVTNITIGYDGEGDPGYNGANHQTSVSFNGSRQTIQLYNGSAITLNNLDFISQPGNGVCYLYDVTITTSSQSATELTSFTIPDGVNGFYLPMDGNSPIGEDKSGNGNNFTPVNFGGSVALDNPQVSGARPILNTTQGGTQAGVGVFGSRENIGYAVTVYNDGGGNKYYIDGVKQDTVTGLIRGATYTFDQSDSTNSNHPLRFSITDNGTHTGGGVQYTDGNVQGGTPGTAGAATTITIPYNAPNTLYYYCGNHSGMGNNITGITTNEKLADQYASNIVFASPLVGANNDVCASIACTMTSKAVTSNGDAAAANEQSNFYSGSFEFDGTGDTLTSAQSSDLTMGTADFTVECWARQKDTSHRGIWQISNTSGGLQESSYGDTLAVGARGTDWQIYGAGTSTESSTYPIASGIWYHLAYVRSSGTSKLYVNGTEVLSKSSDTFNYDGTYLVIGGYYNSSYLYNGYIQDFRVYKGVAKYTSDFVVPSRSPDILPETPSGVSGGSKLTKITDGAVTFDGTGDYLELANSSDFSYGSGDWTVECYHYSLKAAASDTNSLIGIWDASNNRRSWLINLYQDYFRGYFSNDGTGGGNIYQVNNSAVKVAPNRWYHVALVRNGNNLLLFQDGELIDTTDVTGQSVYDNTTDPLRIGARAGDVNYTNGFISNIRVVKGTALYTSDFTPPTAPLTDVTNTKLLCCQSNTSATEGAVKPGTITANGDAAPTTFNPFITDIHTIRGQETGYATLNPLNTFSSTLSDGNLNWSSSTTYGQTQSTIVVSSGKWYYEAAITAANHLVGIKDATVTSTTASSWSGNRAYYSADGNKFLDGTSTAYGAAFVAGDVIGVALDMDAGTLVFYKNGVSQGTAFTGITGTQALGFLGSNGSAASSSINFGQKPFKFPPPDGFQPVNAANTRPVNVITRSDQYVGVTTYTGTGSSKTLSDYNHKPDFVWIKRTNGAGHHSLFDSVRGATKIIYSNLQNAENTIAESLSAFNDKGFTVVSDNDVNGSSSMDYVAYGWKAGGDKNTFNVDDIGYASAAAAGLTAGSVTPTGASVGTKQGFSIIKWTADDPQDNSATIPHGLTQKPDFWAIKSTTRASTDWIVYTQQIDGSLDFGHFNSTEAFTNSSATAPTATTFGVYGDDINYAAATQIAYLWHSVPGLQKFGRFAGNGDSDGVYVELGFKPAILLIKNDGDTGDWIIWDNERNKTNPVNRQIWPYTTSGTYGDYDQVGANYPLDFLSNGFKMRTSDADMNSSSRNYIYAAWAEAPSVDLFGGGANAR